MPNSTLVRQRLLTVAADAVEDTCTPTLSRLGTSVSLREVPVPSQQAELKPEMGSAVPGVMEAQ